jgi:hypothetical protein
VQGLVDRPASRETARGGTEREQRLDVLGVSRLALSDPHDPVVLSMAATLGKAEF